MVSQTVVDTAAKCASITQAQRVEELLPAQHHQGVEYLLSGVQQQQLISQYLSSNMYLDASMTKRKSWNQNKTNLMLAQVL